jgi:DNA-binding MarR family transcriptional regulator
MSREPTKPDGFSDRQQAINVALRAHRLLGQTLGREFYSVPALDMLFDLYLLGNRKPRSLTSLCGASPAPVRTALRTINRMVDRGLLVRVPDIRDARRVNVALTQEAIALMDSFFCALEAILP